MVPTQSTVYGSVRLSIFSRPNWVLQIPHPQERFPPSSGKRGEIHSLAGGRGADSEDATDTLLLQVYYNPSTGT
jgi:hypothetical protein